MIVERRMGSSVQAVTPEQLRDILTANSVDLGANGRDDIFGFGRVDALAAFIAQKKQVTAQPAWRIDWPLKVSSMAPSAVRPCFRSVLRVERTAA